MGAAHDGHMEVCKWLLEHGANLTASTTVRVGHPNKLLLQRMLLLQLVTRLGLLSSLVIIF